MKIRYFAWLREKIGRAEDDMDVPASVLTVGDLITWLRDRGAGYAAAFVDPRLVRCAVDHEFAGADVEILQAEEIAFFPPVTGG